MEIVAESQRVLLTYAQSVGVALLALIVLQLVALFIVAPFSWKAKGVFRLVLANEARGVAVAASAWTFLHS